ncbi:hypothetical protein EDC14_1001123 [Hydrogenispora ethanolica]|jgi:hypothetical protein|uniref:Uncharacterized protein n=1 Tax=Hydrogenispora ethanolica TaxID=1082276 RepID=A0A4R1SCT4_HYDET|nr:hypothetical protein [Hydrogenispora ethanolica]TCL76840.1 hypothetical protein EDC14_1001123 [Hydrogenispora ethanolica]
MFSQAIASVQKLLENRGLLPSFLVISGWIWVIILILVLIYHIFWYLLKKLS